MLQYEYIPSCNTKVKGIDMEKEKYFTVGKAAEKAHLTAETLRHYDRIGLVRPSHTDKWTGYRGYTEGDLVRLNTVRALRCMELPLREIKEILSFEEEIPSMNEIFIHTVSDTKNETA